MKLRRRVARPNQSADVQAVLNFPKSEIQIHYYFSEEDAKTIVEKLNKKDVVGTAMAIRRSVRGVLHGILQRHPGNRIKIIHEAVPEMFLESMDEMEEESVLGGLVRKAGSMAKSAGKAVLKKLIHKVAGMISSKAYSAISKFFKERANEFKEAQAQPADGVTITLTWKNVPGMSALKSVIGVIKGKGISGGIPQLNMPDLGEPEITIAADRKFE